MKKALVILMALSMVFAAFADEPAVKNEIAEFKGDATVTWGVNLDGDTTLDGTKRYTGFKNEENANLKFVLVDTGDKSTTGEGVWGEIQIKLGDDPLQYNIGGDAGTVSASVGKAKIHLGDMLAIGIRKGDVAVGTYKPVLAAHSEGHKVGEAGGLYAIDQETGNKVQAAEPAGTDFATPLNDDDGTTKKEKRTSQGITLEVSLPDLLDLNVDFRSDGTYKAAKDGKKGGVQQWKPDRIQYTDNYGLAADVNVKAVKDASIKAGFGMDFYNDGGENEENDFGFFAAADYKLGLSDTMYLKPQVGFTMQNSYDTTNHEMAITNTLVGAVFVGWGKENQDTNIKYLDKKVSDGFSVATVLTFGDDMKIPLCVGVWDSTFVENLKVGAELCVADLGHFADKFSSVFEFTYKLMDVIAPTFAFKYAQAPNATIATNTDKTLNLYAAVAYTGIANTTFTLAYESGNLAADSAKAGTINLSAKVSF